MLGAVGSESNYPLIQLRRSSQIITAFRANVSIATSIGTNLYNFTMTEPVGVKAGDVLVINSSGNASMYYQRHNGPLNYEINNGNNLSLLSNGNDYPLISIVVGKW